MKILKIASVKGDRSRMHGTFLTNKNIFFQKIESNEFNLNTFRNSDDMNSLPRMKRESRISEDTPFDWHTSLR